VPGPEAGAEGQREADSSLRATVHGESCNESSNGRPTPRILEGRVHALNARPPGAGPFPPGGWPLGSSRRDLGGLRGPASNALYIRIREQRPTTRRRDGPETPRVSRLVRRHRTATSCSRCRPPLRVSSPRQRPAAEGVPDDAPPGWGIVRHAPPSRVGRPGAGGAGRSAGASSSGNTFAAVGVSRSCLCSAYAQSQSSDTPVLQTH
jgi:hypothetical protein